MEIITIKDVCQIWIFFILRRQFNYTQMEHLRSRSSASSFFSSSTDGTFPFATRANTVGVSQWSAPPPPQFQVHKEEGTLGKSETLGTLHCLGPWHYYFIMFPSWRKQIGLPDHDFYLLFLSQAPKASCLFPETGPRSAAMERARQHLQTFC